MFILIENIFVLILIQNFFRVNNIFYNNLIHLNIQSGKNFVTMIHTSDFFSLSRFSFYDGKIKCWKRLFTILKNIITKEKKYRIFVVFASDEKKVCVYLETSYFFRNLFKILFAIMHMHW